MLYLIYKIGIFLIQTLPLSISYLVANIIGSTFYLLHSKDRKIVANNIRVVLGEGVSEQKVRNTTRLIFVNFGRYLVEFFRGAKVNASYLKENITVEGIENLKQALEKGKGALLLSAHLGNWELGAVVLSMLGYPVNIVAWTHKNRSINNLFLKHRTNHGVKAIPLGVALRKVFEVLKNNETVAVLGDIDFIDPTSGIAVEFFGKPTIIPKGPAMFSLKTGAPIVPTFLVREKNQPDKLKLIMEKPIMHEKSDNKQKDLTQLTQKAATALESYIRRYPEQWFMLKPRWKEIKK